MSVRRRNMNNLRRRIGTFKRSNRRSMTIAQGGLGIDTILEVVGRQARGQRLTMRIDDEFYPLNDDNITRLQSIIRNRIMDEDVEIRDSDELIVQTFRNANEFELIKENIRRERNNGAFFKYYNKTNIDLSDYGVYRRDQFFNSKEQCLIQSLRVSKMFNSQTLSAVKLLVRDSKIPFNKLNIIVDELKCNIELNTIGRNNKVLKLGNNKKDYGRKVKIGYIDNHYFYIGQVKCTQYYLKNYERLKGVKDGYKMYRDKYTTEDRYIDSYKVIKYLFENKERLLKPIKLSQDIYTTQFFDKVSDKFETLEYNESDNVKKVELGYKERDPLKNIFFDFETYNRKSDGRAIPYMVCYTDDDGNTGTYHGVNCGRLFLEDVIKQDTQLIAHNAAFDFRFIVGELMMMTYMPKGRGLISAEGTFNGFKVKIKDSYKLITMGLGKFGDCFKLEVKKDVMPYGLYNEDNVEEKMVEIEEGLKHIKEGDKHRFLTNIDEWGLKVGKYFDHITYSENYCLLDCDVLKKGYNKFRGWILEISNMDINFILTSASFAFHYFVKEGCLNGCYYLSGVPRAFIQKCVVGGRCMTRDNRKYWIKNTKIADLDGVSLYPSSMERIGFIMGVPKVITKLDYDWLKKQDSYYVEIQILEIGIKRHFPLISYVDDGGVRQFVNGMEGKRVFIDKISLEDAINFVGLKFKIIRGYYYNDGKNYKINEIIKKLFVKRLEKKKEGNPIQSVYKLIMNSGYGKMITKPIDSETKIFNSHKKMKQYTDYNYNFIKSVVKIVDTNKYYVNAVKPINKHFSLPHIGVDILAMSKRIMNEVMCLAEDNDLSIYYQDTDSMHIVYDEVNILAELFNKKYNRELLGKKLGQFHIDFSLKGALTETIKATETIILGKKCYYDKLEGNNDKGDKIEGKHYRMKGVPTDVIDYHCDKNVKKHRKLYEDLFFDNIYESDLTNDGNKINFEFTNDMVIKNNPDFKRTIKFIGEGIIVDGNEK